jgi:hypothetical protein
MFKSNRQRPGRVVAILLGLVLSASITVPVDATCYECRYVGSAPPFYTCDVSAPHTGYHGCYAVEWGCIYSGGECAFTFAENIDVDGTLISSSSSIAKSIVETASVLSAPTALSEFLQNADSDVIRNCGGQILSQRAQSSVMLPSVGDLVL